MSSPSDLLFWDVERWHCSPKCPIASKSIRTEVEATDDGYQPLPLPDSQGFLYRVMQGDAGDGNTRWSLEAGIATMAAEITLIDGDGNDLLRMLAEDKVDPRGFHVIMLKFKVRPHEPLHLNPKPSRV